MALLDVQPTIMKTSPSFLSNNNQNIDCQGHENYKDKWQRIGQNLNLENITRNSR
jgi:hypothetical protein